MSEVATIVMAVLVVLVASGVGLLRAVSRLHGCHAHQDPEYSVEAILIRIGWERIEAEPIDEYGEPSTAGAGRPRWPSADPDAEPTHQDAREVHLAR